MREPYAEDASDHEVRQAVRPYDERAEADQERDRDDHRRAVAERDGEPDSGRAEGRRTEEERDAGRGRQPQPHPALEGAAIDRRDAVRVPFREIAVASSF